MFGLTFEKLFLIAVIAALVVGPHRLPEYARSVARAVRKIRDMVDDTKSKTLTVEEWAALDPRRYDPRAIAADALAETPSDATTLTSTTSDDAEVRKYDQSVYDQAERIRPGQRYLIAGDAAHPCRVRLDSLPADDPRRLASEAIVLID